MVLIINSQICLMLIILKGANLMLLLLFILGVLTGLAVGVYLGGEIIDERNKELKYLRKELAKANEKVVKGWFE